MKKIAIFASGAGSNAFKIIDFFENDASAKVVLVLTNNANAGVLDIAQSHGIPTKIFDRNTFYNTAEIPNLLTNKKIDIIALAGFLWLIPDNMVQAFPNKIINIHPALLPKYGGKGMYGHHVHEAVKANNEKESGITIHYVNENYDEGNIILQRNCVISPQDKAQDIAKKVLQLEHKYFPIVLKEVLTK
jgi:phosphoribosylglycinamide formyltransferase 1